MRPTPCGCTSARLSGIHRNCLFCGNTASVPPVARPHKLHIPRPAASGRSRPFRCSSSPNCKRFAGLQFGSICLARKSRQKEALRPRKLHIPRPAASGRPRPFRCSSSPNCKRFAGLQFGSYIARCRARFLAVPRPERPDGRRTAIFLIAYGSDECTTRICGQTASISLLLISGILGRLRFCTTGAYADGLPFPRQGVLPSPCVETAIDGSVVSTQAAL